MPKYYCRAGEYENIVDAEDVFRAALKSVTKAIKNNSDMGFLMAINEKGFESSENIVTPIIPILKIMGFEKTNGEWMDIVCEGLKTPLENICPKQLKWYITGILEGNNEHKI
jgi:hypothetical protein